jgi:hypothetical protein
MKFQNIRLGKIGDHICTNRRIKLRENRRNIKLFRNKHKVVTTFIHVSNDKQGQHQDREQKEKTQTATKAYEPNSWSYTWREKNNRKLTLRHKRRKEYQPSFVIFVAKNSVRRGEGPQYDSVAHHQKENQSLQKLAK